MAFRFRFRQCILKEIIILRHFLRQKIGQIVKIIKGVSSTPSTHFWWILVFWNLGWKLFVPKLQQNQVVPKCLICSICNVSINEICASFTLLKPHSSSSNFLKKFKVSSVTSVSDFLQVWVEDWMNSASLLKQGSAQRRSKANMMRLELRLISNLFSLINLALLSPFLSTWLLNWKLAELIRLTCREGGPQDEPKCFVVTWHLGMVRISRISNLLVRLPKNG